MGILGPTNNLESIGISSYSFASGNLLSLMTYVFILCNRLTMFEYLLANVTKNKYRNLSFQEFPFLLSGNKAGIQTAETFQ